MILPLSHVSSVIPIPHDLARNLEDCCLRSGGRFCGIPRLLQGRHKDDYAPLTSI